MNIFKAKKLVEDWLEGVGVPTKEVPLTYDYTCAYVTDGGSCAGAAIAWLLGDYNASEVGEKYFGDREAFFDLAFKQGGVHAAAALRNLRSLTILPEFREEPKIWRNMTPEEKGALLLARHEGKAIEVWDCNSEGWVEVIPTFTHFDTYRIKPEPVVEQRNLYVYGVDWSLTQVGTINLVDGQPDPTTIRMEEV